MPTDFICLKTEKETVRQEDSQSNNPSILKIGTFGLFFILAETRA